MTFTSPSSSNSYLSTDWVKSTEDMHIEAYNPAVAEEAPSAQQNSDEPLFGTHLREAAGAIKRLGMFDHDKLDDAVQARRKAELKYCGKYAPKKF